MKRFLFVIAIAGLLTSCGKTANLTAETNSAGGNVPVATTETVVASQLPVGEKGSSAGAETFIGEEKAKEIALQKAGLSAADVKFVRVEIDRENGVPVYEVEFNEGPKEYSAEIKADDGTILEWDVDMYD